MRASAPKRGYPSSKINITISATAPATANKTCAGFRLPDSASEEAGWSSKFPSERRAARSKPCMSLVTAPIPHFNAASGKIRTPAKYRKS